MTDFWPVKWPDSVNVDDLEEADRRYAEVLAVQSLRTLTLHRVGISAVRADVLPTMNEGTYSVFHSLPTYAGTLGVNPSSAHLKSTLASHRSIKLIAPIHRIIAVSVNGELVNPADYAVVSGAYLVRTNGEWPWGQKISIDYETGYPADFTAQIAAGRLAQEFLLALQDSPRCSLPRGVTEISRQGVTLTIEAGLFPDGLTGIPAVDSFIYQWNPNGLRSRPRVYSPDVPQTGASW